MDINQPLLVARQSYLYCFTSALKKAIEWLLLAGLLATFTAALDGALDHSDIIFISWLLQPISLVCLGFAIVSGLTLNFGERLELQLDVNCLTIQRHGAIHRYQLDRLYHVRISGFYPTKLTLYTNGKDKPTRLALTGIRPRVLLNLTDRLTEEIKTINTPQLSMLSVRPRSFNH